MKKESNQTSLAEVLQEFIKKNNLQAGIDKVNVQKIWKDLMGNGVNSYTTKVNLKNNILYVELSSSVLRQELIYGKEKIINMLNDSLRKDIIKDIIFR